MGTYLLVDGNSLTYRAFFALPSDMATASGQVTNAVFGFTSMLAYVIKDQQPDGILGGSPGGVGGGEDLLDSLGDEGGIRGDDVSQGRGCLGQLVERHRDVVAVDQAQCHACLAGTRDVLRGRARDHVDEHEPRNRHRHEAVEELNRPPPGPEEEEEEGRHHRRGQAGEEEGHSAVWLVEGGYCNGKDTRIESSPGAK